MHADSPTGFESVFNVRAGHLGNDPAAFGLLPGRRDGAGQNDAFFRRTIDERDSIVYNRRILIVKSVAAGLLERGNEGVAKKELAVTDR